MKLILIYIILFYSCESIDYCEPSERIMKYISSQKGFDKGKFIKVTEISKVWYTNGGTETITCPNLINGDFTKDGYEDIILMYRDNDGIPFIVSLINYQSKNPKFQVISEINDFGKSGLGDVLYTKNGNIYIQKLESSLSKITWINKKFVINENLD